MVMSITKVRSTPPVSELWTSTLTTCSELSDLLISGHAESSSKWFNVVCLFFFWMRLPLVACSVVSLPNGMCGERKNLQHIEGNFPAYAFPFLSVPQGWSTVQATRTAARYALSLISHLCAGTPSAPSQELYSQALDSTQDRYWPLTTSTNLASSSFLLQSQ